MRRLPTAVRIPVIVLVLFVSYGVCLQAAPVIQSPVLVQSAFAGSANGQTSLTATFPNVPTPGNVLVAIVGVKPGDSIEGVFSAGGGFQTAINEPGTTSPRRPGQGIFLQFVTVANGEGTQVTAATSPSTIGLQIFEYHFSQNPAFTFTGSSNGPGSAPATVNSLHFGGPGNLNVAGITIDTPDSITGVSDGFTERFDFVAGSSGGRATYGGADRDGAASTTTFSHGNNVWRAQLVLFY